MSHLELTITDGHAKPTGEGVCLESSPGLEKLAWWRLSRCESQRRVQRRNLVAKSSVSSNA